jgi:membrane protein YqaA with SNARE-associated domain
MSDTLNVEAPKGPLRRLYAWVMENAQGPNAWAALAALAFMEAAFLPIPPDIMLMPMMLADRKRVFALAAWCTVWSVLGGLLGYAIGAFFWQTWGVWLIGVLHVPLSEVEMLRSKYGAHAYLMVVQVLTPVPFTLVSVSAGLARVPLAAFVLYATILRSLRFIVLEGVLVHFFGDRARVILERYMEVVVVTFLVVLVLAFVALRYL